jgi:hypothetical protein
MELEKGGPSEAIAGLAARWNRTKTCRVNLPSWHDDGRVIKGMALGLVLMVVLVMPVFLFVMNSAPK